jgi:hypothetical protein
MASIPSEAPGLAANRYTSGMLAIVAAARAISWTPLAGAATVAVAGAAALRWLTPTAHAEVILLTVAILAAGTACVVDDAAAATLVGSPTALRARLLTRMACGIAAGAVSWSATAATIRLATGAAPTAQFTLLWAALTATSLSIAAASTRLFPNTEGGLVAAVTLLLGLLVSALAPPVSVLARLAGAAPWDHPTERLMWTIGTTISVTVWATRDPARRHRHPALFVAAAR